MNCRRLIALAIALGLAGLAALLRPYVLPGPHPAQPAAIRGGTYSTQADGAESDAAGDAASAPRPYGDRATPVASPPAGPVVDVVGAVRHPGVYALAIGARLVAAVHAAGGFRDGADENALDLAARARDGEQIVVPNAGERARIRFGGGSADAEGGRPAATLADAPATGDVADASGTDVDVPNADASPPRPRRRSHRRGHRRRRRSASVASSAGAEPDAATRSPDPIDLNTASPEELETLPGIGAALAERIVEFRETAGPFERPEELLDVNGMTDARYAAIERDVTTSRP